MSKIDDYCDYAIDVANDNSHGYSQVWRFPEQGSSYDCSSLVISALQYGAGIPVRDKGATYTGNMARPLEECGFHDIGTSGINWSTGDGLKKGDILLNEAAHTVIYIGNGKVVNARSAEGTHNQIDDSGNEIRIQSLWNFPWDKVYRLENEAAYDKVAEEEYVIPQPDIPDEVSVIVQTEGEPTIVPAEPIALPHNAEPEVHICRMGENTYFVGAMQCLLWVNGYYPQVDCMFSAKTGEWLLKYQRAMGLYPDVQCGEETWTALIGDPFVLLGDHGYIVSALQYFLKAHKYWMGASDVDGIFGDLTYRQLNRFKESRGLNADGIADAETFLELIKI